MPRAGYLVIALSLLGAVVSVYLYDVHLHIHAGHGEMKGFCSINETFQCESAARSQWSTAFGVPISAWGLGYYLGLATLFGIIPWVSENTAKRTFSLVFLLVAASMVYSLFLLGVSLLVLRTICPMCLTLYVINTLTFITLWWVVPVALVKSLPRSLGKTLFSPPAFVFTLVMTLTVSSLVGYAEDVAADDNDISALALLEERWDDTQSEPKGEYQTSDDLSTDLSSPAFSGNPNARVKIVVFSDFGCGFCRQLHDALNELVEEYPHDILIEWKHFPLDPECNPKVRATGHPFACLSARLNIAAQEQGKAVQLAELFFDIQQIPAAKRTEDLYFEAAKELELDVDALKGCADEGKCGERLRRDVEEAISRDITITPTLFIGDKKIPGFPGRLIIKGEIEKALNP